MSIPAFRPEPDSSDVPSVPSSPVSALPASPVSPAPPTPLKLLRLARGLTQTDLTLATGLPQPAISAIENGRLTPGITRANVIAEALGADVRDLFPELADSSSKPQPWRSRRRGPRPLRATTSALSEERQAV